MQLARGQLEPHTTAIADYNIDSFQNIVSKGNFDNGFRKSSGKSIRVIIIRLQMKLGFRNYLGVLRLGVSWKLEIRFPLKRYVDLWKRS